jgi:hypothetical protein
MKLESDELMDVEERNSKEMSKSKDEGMRRKIGEGEKSDE